MIGFLASAFSGFGQITITNRLTFAYTNNFNTLANSGTPVWTDNTTMVGWYASRNVGGVNTAMTNYLTGNGSSATGGVYSYGSTSTTDRALGSQPTIAGATTIAYGVRLRNTTGSTITNITVAYTGEQWRRAASGGATSLNQTLAFSYRISASSITSPDPANTIVWTNVSALNFDSPIDTRSGGGAALNGNSTVNRVSYQVTFAISLPNNSEIFLRWVDVDDANNDHGLAIDDVRIYVPEMGTIGPLTMIAVIAGFGYLRRRGAGTKTGRPGTVGATDVHGGPVPG